MPITDPDRRTRLAASFNQDAAVEDAQAYDAVRPRYPVQIVRRLLKPGGWALSGGSAEFFPTAPRQSAHLTDEALRPGDTDAQERPRVVELGAGTGILTRALLMEGANVDAVEPSPPMAQVMADRWESEAGAVAAAPADRLVIHRTTAERTGLSEGHADLVVAAQAWHWFDHEAVVAEARRLLRPGGAFAVVGNFLDTSVDWVHRLTRIMRAGDVYRPGWKPWVDEAAFQPWSTVEERWARTITPEGLRRLARTLSSWLSAGESGRERMARNLTWYLDEFLPEAHPEAYAGTGDVRLPYITVLHTTCLR